MSTQPTSYCTFNVSGATCGIPVDRVREVVSDEAITPVPLAHQAVAGLINLRGHILTVVDAQRLMNLGDGESTSSHNRHHVIVDVDDERISLLVDEMGSVLTPQLSQIETTPTNLDYSVASLITLAARMPDCVLLILNIDHIVSLMNRPTARLATRD